MIFENKTYEELIEIQDDLDFKYKTIREDSLKNGLSFDEFCERSKDTKENLYFLSKYKRLLQPPTLVYDKKWKGKVYELDGFIKECKEGMFTDNDGYGEYATHNAKSDVKIIPSDILENIYRKDFTHVIWFNR